VKKEASFAWAEPHSAKAKLTTITQKNAEAKRRVDSRLARSKSIG
jgi:hypothetical protein